jgi:protein involved in ribonucleotide reduction
MEIVYFSNYSGNTKRFVEKISDSAIQIPITWDPESPLIVDKDFVLFVPTYGGGSETHSVPRQVVKFLNIEQNREHLAGIVGFGNTNFGENYCKAAEIIATKTGAPILYRVEITGTQEDVLEVKKRMETLWQNTAITN